MAGQCEHCEYIGCCPRLESGYCDGGAYSFKAEDGRVWRLVEVSPAAEPDEEAG